MLAMGATNPALIDSAVGTSGYGASSASAASSSAGLSGGAAVGMQAGGALVSAIGAFYGVSAQRAALESQARIQAINARIADESARAALFAGQRQSETQRLRTAQLKSAQQASMAANGLDLSEGTPLRVQTDTDALGLADAYTIEANAVRSAWGYKIDATNMRGDALMRRAEAGGISPGLSAATSLLGSASSVASGWYQLSRRGG